MIKQKIMKTVYRFLLVALLAMAATSCLYEDKGNYDYHAINDITIGGIASGQEYPVVSFVDTLRIKPQITCAQSTDESTLEYQWSVLITEGKQYERVIGKEKNLEWPADLKAGKYTGLLKVYDKISGLSWIQSFKIVATTVTSEGYLVLCRQENRPRMDIIHTVDQDRELVGRDIFDGGSLVGEPIGFDYTSGLWGSLVLHTSESSWSLNTQELTISEESDLKYEFGMPPASVDARKVEITTLRNDNVYVLIDAAGDMYIKREWGELYALPINHLKGEDTYFEMAPWIGVRKGKGITQVDQSIMLFDNTNKRFMEIPGGAFLPRVMQYENTDLWPSAQVDKEIIHMESNMNYTFALMKDSGGKVWVYGVELNGDSKNVQKYLMEVKGSGIEKATAFAFHSLYPYLFYAVGGEVYRFDYSMQAPAEKVLTYPDATVVKLHFPIYLGWIACADWQKERQYNLVVGYNNTKKPETNCGTVAIYKVPALRGDLTLFKEYTDLGYIIDLAYKENN